MKAFQTAQGIAADGIVGDVTWINIDEADMSDPTIRRGSTGNPVRRAQKRLTLGGYDTGGVDGVFGANTEAAVRRFQGDRALTVDGIVGPRDLGRDQRSGRLERISPRSEPSPSSLRRPGPGHRVGDTGGSGGQTVAGAVSSIGISIQRIT